MGGLLEITGGGRGGENFSGHNFFFFSSLVRMIFFLALHEFIFFPYIIVFLGGGGELPRKHLLTDRTTYLNTYLPF